MKSNLNIFILVFSFTSCLATEKIKTEEVKNKKITTETTEKPQRVLVDQIVARVNGVNIVKSVIEKPQIVTGQPLSVEDAIKQELLFQKAVDFKFIPTPAEVEKQISNFRISNNLHEFTDEEFENELKKEGLNYIDYKNQMARFIAVERLKGAEFAERAVVTKQEVEDFYKKNPSWHEEKYLLNICEVSSDQVGADGNLVKSDDLKWEDLGWVLKKDLSHDLSFVLNMKKDEISKPVKKDDVYQIVKVLDRSENRLKTIDERYLEIESVLQAQKKQVFEIDYEAELRKDASIVYLT
jgi:parvulin-like peptidyl-prolyl isomerase